MICCTNYLQAGASKWGNTVNAMDKGATDIGNCTSTRTGSNVGMLPSELSSKGLPLRTMVWLWRYLSLGVKWYSSLCTACSCAFLPTHTTVFFRTWTKEPCLLMVFWMCISMFMLFRTATLNVVALLKLINNRVTPAYIKRNQIRTIASYMKETK